MHSGCMNTDIDIDTDEFLSQLRAGWDNAAEDHLAHELEVHAGADAEEVEQALAEIARDAADEERAHAEALRHKIEGLQDWIASLQRQRREALALARAYERGFTALIK